VLKVESIGRKLAAFRAKAPQVKDLDTVVDSLGDDERMVLVDLGISPDNLIVKEKVVDFSKEVSFWQYVKSKVLFEAS
jgi:hypothetical protein